MYRVNKSSVRSQRTRHRLLSRPSKTDWFRLGTWIVLRIVCPGKVIYCSSELRRASRPNFPTFPSVVQQRYRGHTLLSSFFIHCASLRSPPHPPPRPGARPLLFFAWPLADNKMATDRDDEYLPPSRIVRISSRYKQIDRQRETGGKRGREALLSLSCNAAEKWYQQIHNGTFRLSHPTTDVCGKLFAVARDVGMYLWTVAYNVSKKYYAVRYKNFSFNLILNDISALALR